MINESNIQTTNAISVYWPNEIVSAWSIKYPILNFSLITCIGVTAKSTD